MQSSSTSFLLLSLSLSLLTVAALIPAAVDNPSFDDKFNITWGDGRGKILGDGRLLTLSLDKGSGSGFQSKAQYLFAKVDMQIKLVPGNSAGTVTAFYLSSPWPNQDEIDYEFLGNLPGQPYIVHTNVFTKGIGNREQQFHLWFDPTIDFHTYSILWSPKHIIFSIDGVPIRDFKKHESKGAMFPKERPMRIYSSIWNADDWATKGGLVKTDWSKAPFTASYRNFNIKGCVRSGGISHCEKWMNEELDSARSKKLRWVQTKYRIYNYCTDRKRHPHPPLECKF